MRILIITATYEPSVNGVAITTTLQKKGLEERGHRVHILCPHHPLESPSPNVTRLPSVPNFKAPDYPLPLLIPTPQIMHTLSQDFDLIYFHQPFFIGGFSQFIARLKSVPNIFFFHSLYNEVAKTHLPPLLHPASDKIIWDWTKKVVRNSSHIIVETPSIRQIVMAYNENTPMSVIPSIRPPMATNSTKRSLRTKYHIPTNIPVVICVSRLSKEKNLDILIPIIASISQKTRFYFCFIGNGPEKNNLASLAKSSETSHCISFLDNIPFSLMPDIYNFADILVHPAKTDTQAVVVTEAMSVGLPIVAFDCQGPRDFVVHNKNGYLASSNEQLSQYLMHLILNSPQRTRFGEQSLKLSTKFSFDKNIDQLGSLFSSVISTRKLC